MYEEKFRLRRRLAVASFYIIVATLAVVIAVAFFGGKHVSSNLSAATGIISPIIVCLTGLVMQYAYQVQKSDEKTMVPSVQPGP